MSAKSKVQKPYKIPSGSAYEVNEPEVARIFNRYEGSFGNPEVKLRVIKTGLNAAALDDFMKIFGGTKDDIARLLHVSDKTIRAYIKESKTMDTGISEHLLQLFELFKKGMEVFGDLAEFKKWLMSHNYGLGQEPLALLDTFTGIECVADELYRIEYGALA